MEDKLDESKNEIVNLNISLKAKDTQLEEKDKEIEDLENSIDKKIKKAEDKVHRKYKKYKIKVPKTTLKETQKLLNMTDPYTKEVIIKYLDLDCYELVQNIAQTVNKHNTSEVISFMDWGLARNMALKTLLEDSIDRRKEYFDKLKWEMVHKEWEKKKYDKIKWEEIK